MLLKPSQSNDNTQEKLGRGERVSWIIQAERQDGWQLETNSQYIREERTEIPRGWLQLFHGMKNRHEQASWGQGKGLAGSHLESNEKKFSPSRGYVGHRLEGSEHAGAI